jgi:hypothetical protein
MHTINVSRIDNDDGEKSSIQNATPLLNIAVADRPTLFNALIKSDNEGSNMICNTDMPAY